MPRAHAILVNDAMAHAIHLHHAIAGDALAEIFVWRQEAHLGDVVAKAVRGGGQGIVGLETGHAPHRDAERGHHFFHQIELRQNDGIEALAGLVAVEQIVAERFDGVVEGRGDVRHRLARVMQQADHRRQKAHRTGDVLAVGRQVGGALGVVRPKQLVGAVEEM